MLILKYRISEYILFSVGRRKYIIGNTPEYVGGAACQERIRLTGSNAHVFFLSFITYKARLPEPVNIKPMLGFDC